jgi:putative SOS response-associated peptidase YedK
MCNSFEQKVSWKAYQDMIEAIAWRGPIAHSEFDLPPRALVRISDPASVIVMPEPGAVELAPMRFSYPPEAGRGPVFNVRSEGRTYERSRRAIVPASAFFEFTDAADKKRTRKDRWRFERTDGDWMGLPAIWKQGTGNQPPGFALPTIEPGDDVGAVHDRQIVVLEKQYWNGWLKKGDKGGFAPSAAGTFTRHLDVGEAAATKAAG